MTEFAHLHSHTEYSLLDGFAHIEDEVLKVKELGMHHMAITDHGNMHGAIEFYQSCVKHNIHPIIGMEAYSCKDMNLHDSQRETNHLLLLAETQEGYENLLKLSTEANTKGYYYKPRIDHKLLEKYSRGIIATSSCIGGVIPQKILRGDMKGAEKDIQWYVDVFGPQHFYMEYQDHIQNNTDQLKVNKVLYELQKKYQLQGIVTNDSHYVEADDYKAHDAFLCIQTKSQIEKYDRFKFDSDQYYVKSPKEMARLFPDNSEWLQNTVLIAERCTVDPSRSKGGLPDFVLPSGYTDHAMYLWDLCLKGIQERYGEMNSSLEAQLKYEFEIIRSKGFISYFLIEWDFVRFARSKGIMCLARGSAAGSLIAYSLGITNVDPIRYQLLFERFMNPERNDMPDIDMDFPDNRREDVIDYVTQKYGREHVAQMVTFNVMAGKGAVRDVARIMDEYQLGDQISRLIPTELNSVREMVELSEDRMNDDSIPLEVVVNDEFTTLMTNNRTAKEIIQLASKIEGYTRNAGVHAAGLAISKAPLRNIAPLAFRDRKNPDSGYVLQYEQKYYEEDLGIIKYDFLGLSNLSTIRECLKNIEITQGLTIDLEKLPLDAVEGDDAANRKRDKAFQLLQDGLTNAVFQLEGVQMTNYLKQLAPTCVEDIMAMIALYRPGPMESIPEFVECKHGRKSVEYLDHRLSEWLEESYGVIVYQDQVLQIAVNLAGFSWGKVNKFRKVLSKKIGAEIPKYREDFINGCVANGVKEEVAEKLFKLIEPFGGYGFNKAHAASYAVVSFYTAYLKANYAVEFMAAALTVASTKKDKISPIIADCKKLGIEILPPDINKSFSNFTVEDGKIRYGLKALKDVGEGPSETIVASRGKGSYRSIDDFLRRSGLGKATFEALVKGVALDSFGQEKHLLLGNAERLCKSGRKEKKVKSAGQLSMFDMIEEEDDSTVLQQSPLIPREKLLEWEREYTGTYFSPHPLSYALASFEAQGCTHVSSDILPDQNGVKVRIGGMINGVQNFTTKKGDIVGIVGIEDMYGTFEIFIPSQIFSKVNDQCKKGNIVIMEGKIRHNEEREKTNISVSSIEKIKVDEPIPPRTGGTLAITLRFPSDEAGTKMGLAMVEKLCKIFENEKDGEDCYEFFVEDEDYITHLVPRVNGVTFTETLYRKVMNIVGEGNATFTKAKEKEVA